MKLLVSEIGEPIPMLMELANFRAFVFEGTIILSWEGGTILQWGPPDATQAEMKNLILRMAHHDGAEPFNILEEYADVRLHRLSVHSDDERDHEEYADIAEPLARANYFRFMRGRAQSEEEDTDEAAE